MLSLDGSCAVEDHLDEDQPAIALSALDHYIGRPTTPQFNEMTLLHYVQQFTMPKQLGSNPSRRRKAFVVIVCPYFSSDPSGPKYEEYCRHKLIRPDQQRRTSRSPRACASIAFELTLAPTIQCIHLVIHPLYILMYHCACLLNDYSLTISSFLISCFLISRSWFCHYLVSPTHACVGRGDL